MSKPRISPSVSGVVALALVAGCSQGTATVSSALMADLDTSKIIPIAQAIEIARTEIEGFPVSATLEIEDDDENEPPAYEVVIFVNGSNDLMAVEVHAETGEVLEVETADEGEDEGGENGGGGS